MNAILKFYENRMNLQQDKLYLKVENGTLVTYRKESSAFSWTSSKNDLAKVEAFIHSEAFQPTETSQEAKISLYFLKSVIWLSKTKTSLVSKILFSEPLPPVYEGPLPQVTKEGVLCGLPNITLRGHFGNTCWLNTALSFISTTSYFDEMLNNEISGEWKELHTQLRTVIANLRFLKNTTLPESLYRQLLREIQKIPGVVDIGEQGDAPEFLFLMMQTLGFQKQIIGTAVYYEEDTKYGKEEERSWFLSAYIPSSYGGVRKKLDIQALVECEEEVEVIPDVGGSKSAVFHQKRVIQDLPQTLMIYLPRVIDFPLIGRAPMRNQIAMQGDLIRLTTSKLILDKESRIIGAEPFQHVFYKIGATMEHTGRGRLAHYVCEEGTEKGVIIHNDNDTHKVTYELPWGRRASFLRLEQVGSPVNIS